jgi:hypothetical protein
MTHRKQFRATSPTTPVVKSVAYPMRLTCDLAWVLKVWLHQLLTRTPLQEFKEWLAEN